MAGKVTTQLVIDGKNTAQKAFAEADGQLNRLSGTAKAAGAAILAAFSVTALSGWVKASIDAIDKTDELAERIGLSAEQFAGLQYAAKFASIEGDALASTLAKFNQTAAKAAQGAKTQSAAFASIGVSVRDASGNVKSSDVLLKEVADRFAELPDGVQKSALAMELFGKSGAKLVPLLNRGGAGIQELVDQAKDLGLVLSDETYKAAGQFNDSLDVLGSVSEGTAQQVAANLLPALNDVTGLLVDLSTKSTASVDASDILGGALKALATVVVVLGTAFKATGSLLGALVAAMSQVAQGQFSQALDTLKNGVADYADTTAAGIGRITKLWNGDYAAAGAAAANTAKNMQSSFDAATSGMGRSVEDAETHLEGLKAVQKSLVKDSKATLDAMVAAQREGNQALEKAKKEQVDTEKRYADALAKLRSGSTGTATYGDAQQLKVDARASLKAGDLDGAKRNAQAALDVLQQMQQAGENTYGFEGFIKELQGIEQAADKVNLDRAKESAEAATAMVTELKSKIDAVKDVKLTINLPPEEVAKIEAAMVALAARLGQTLTIKAAVSTPAGLISNTTPGDPDVPMPGYATGGHVRGPGSGTSDSIMARLSNGEFVMRAAAVQHFGSNLLERMNGLQVPRFAEGGLVDAALSAPAGADFPDLGRLEFAFGGQSYEMYAPPSTAKELRTQRLKFGRTKK